MKNLRSFEIFRGIIRGLFGFIFIGGGIVHIILGRLSPDDYAVFALTPPFEWMKTLWTEFAIPNIGWLTLLLAAYEITAGVLVFLSGRKVRIGAILMLVFLVLITLNGYGWETASVTEDFLKNRLATIIMAALVIPLLLKPEPPRFLDSFRARKETSND